MGLLTVIVGTNIKIIFIIISKQWQSRHLKTHLRQTLHNGCRWVTFGSSYVDSYVQLVAVVNVVSFPVDVRT